MATNHMAASENGLYRYTPSNGTMRMQSHPVFKQSYLAASENRIHHDTPIHLYWLQQS